MRVEGMSFAMRAEKLCGKLCCSQGFPGGSVVKNPPASIGDAGSIPGSGRSLEKEMATHSSTLAWEISWTEEPGPLQSMESQKSLTGLSDETTQTQVF